MSTDSFRLPLCVPLNTQQTEYGLRQLQGWHWDREHGSIAKTWVFDRFTTAAEFFAQLAVLAEQQDHHPEVTSAYTRMQVRLWTHDVQGISSRDFALAHALDALVAAVFSNRLSTQDTP